MSGPTHTDAMVALTGASAALAGLVLVFLGVLVAAYQPLVGNTTDQILGRFKTAAVWTLVVFGISLISLTASATWLLVGGSHRFFVAVIVLFFVQLGALAGIAGYSTFGVLLKG